MLKRACFLATMVALMWALAPSAEAAMITGDLSISGALVPVNGSTGMETPSFTTATGLDFTLAGHVPTPGTPGAFTVNSTSGDFSILPLGTTGTIKDFTFSGVGSANFPVVPIAGFELDGFGFALDLLSISNVVHSSPNLLSLEGTGLFHLAGFENTLGTFVFSANQSGDTFSFSASEGTVPEPGSMLLLGTGLIGLAGATRRRWRANA